MTTPDRLSATFVPNRGDVIQARSPNMDARFHFTLRVFPQRPGPAAAEIHATNRKATTQTRRHVDCDQPF
jgi:hypothetical protein